MENIIRKILDIDKNICENIELYPLKRRDFISSNVLQYLRTFVEHLNFLIYQDDKQSSIEHTWDNIQAANKHIQALGGDYKAFRDLHFYTQASVSHYSPIDDASERLMLKYYEYLVKIKKYIYDRFNLNILSNIFEYPQDIDQSTIIYYQNILEQVKEIGISTTTKTSDGKFYITKKKAIIVNNTIMYELTLSPASDYSSKFDRVTAYTLIDILPNYSVRVSMKKADVKIFGKYNNIAIIDNYSVSIRVCEVNNLFRLLNLNKKIEGNYREYLRLMNYMTTTKNTLLDLVTMDYHYYTINKRAITKGLRATYIFDALDLCRMMIRQEQNGINVVRYLLFSMNNVIIKDQTDTSGESAFFPYNITNKSFPFEKNPFVSSLYKHNIRFRDIVSSIPTWGREHELLARRIINNTENKRQLYTPKDELSSKTTLMPLVKKYNKEFSDRYKSRRITLNNKYAFINSYEEDTINIITNLKKYTCKGLTDYTKSFFSWVENNPSSLDSIEKKEILENLFTDTKISLIYGAAGTGKTTLIKYIAEMFTSEKKLFLTNTHPALSNLKNKIGESNNKEFSTISSYKYRKEKESYDIVFIDECSTISNRDMVYILNKLETTLIVLVGDIYQIESISFGNWFNISKELLPKHSINELFKPFRTTNNNLIELWERVRKMDDKLTEYINKFGYSTTLSDSILEKRDNDEIILCLNYDGLYGINNINRYLQNNNPSQAFEWELNTFKVNDPIIFNESKRFSPLIYNNMKGTIVNISKTESRITFDIELQIAINELQAKRYDFKLLESESEYSVIRFSVQKRVSNDTDDTDYITQLPFQVAYAVSIHKSQGLEYQSVKIVFTKEVEEMISHNLFYTAITRSRDKLKIYWTPECEHYITTHMSPINSKRDANILKNKLKTN